MIEINTMNQEGKAHGAKCKAKRLLSLCSLRFAKVK